MVKRSIAPLNRIVAGLARRRETCGSVIHRRDRVRVIVLMARDACGVRQVVVIVQVTIGTLPRRHRVCAGKRESRTAVIECRIQPGGCVVALLATLRKVRRNVVRVGRALIVLEVAANASVRRQVVVIVGMTVGTLPRRYRMHSCQGEVRIAVIKRCVRPRSGVMALLTGLREVSRDVVRIIRSLIVLQVAGYTCSAAEVVIVVDMTIRALSGRNRMSTAERKSHRTVIELRIQPGIRAMTVIASRGEHSRDMVGITCSLEVLGVAGIALRRHCLELACRCALVA